MPGVRPGGRVTFCLRQKVTKNRFEYLRQNSLRAGGAPFRQLAASQIGRGVFRHFAALVPLISRLREMFGLSALCLGFQQFPEFELLDFS